jgi:hypothetical protein
MGVGPTVGVRAIAERWSGAPLQSRVAIAITLAALLLTSTRSLLRRALRGPGSAVFRYLPISRAAALAYDTVAILIFDAPAIFVVMACTVSGSQSGFQVLVNLCIAVLVCVSVGFIQAATLDAFPTSLKGSTGVGDWQLNRLPSPAVRYELHWLRGESRQTAGSVAVAILSIGAGAIAVRNNDVKSPMAIATIMATSAVIAATVLALTSARRLYESRVLRTIDATLPQSALTSLRRSWLCAALSCLPIVVAIAFVALRQHPAALYSAAHLLSTFVVLVLLGLMQREGEFRILPIIWAGAVIALSTAFAPVLTAIALFAIIAALERMNVRQMHEEDVRTA